MDGSSMYASLCELLDFMGAAHVLEVFDGASRGVAPRDSVAADVDDEAVIDAVFRLLVDGVAVEAGHRREDLLYQAPQLTERGRRLHEALSQI